ncbi:MAG: hypothetical protein E2O93_01965 [Alphaproteobacteria bacterium]|nr:MAG: hypothetical protein E2O93_01965 [Alphaproteobacteria bacterium]
MAQRTNNSDAVRARGIKVATAQVLTQATAQVRTTPRASILASALLLAVFGISLVWVSGFANADVLHNGAHDSRHSLVFPCH